MELSITIIIRHGKIVIKFPFFMKLKSPGYFDYCSFKPQKKRQWRLIHVQKKTFLNKDYVIVFGNKFGFGTKIAFENVQNFFSIQNT